MDTAQAENKKAAAEAEQNPQRTLSGQPLQDLAERADAPTEDLTPAEGVKRAAESVERAKEPETQSRAMEWLLSPDAGQPAQDRKAVRLNIGNEENPAYIEWVVRPVQMDTMRRIRKQAQNTREARRSGMVDDYRINLNIVAAGTAEPNLREAAKLLYEQGRIPSADPADALAYRFASKPGFIAQLSAQVMAISGFDDEDVQDATAVEAAKN